MVMLKLLGNKRVRRSLIMRPALEKTISLAQLVAWGVYTNLASPAKIGHSSLRYFQKCKRLDVSGSTSYSNSFSSFSNMNFSSNSLSVFTTYCSIESVSVTSSCSICFYCTSKPNIAAKDALLVAYNLFFLVPGGGISLSSRSGCFCFVIFCLSWTPPVISASL